jgi:uncharacterized membrane protein
MPLGKCVALTFGFFLTLDLAGLFGPGPLVPGLGPFFDLVVMVAVVFLLVVIAAPLFARIFRKANSAGKTEPEISSPEDILRARYARGDLDRSQFLQILEDLSNRNPRAT